MNKIAIVFIGFICLLFCPRLIYSQIFTELDSQFYGVIESSGTWGDYNNDGDLDIIYTGRVLSFGNTLIYTNIGFDTFNHLTNLIGAYRGFSDWGDYDNDGDLDIIVGGKSGILLTTNIYRNDGNGNFTNINAKLKGVYHSSGAWGDYDNDGDLDVFMCGYSDSGSIFKIYKNIGDSIFSDTKTKLIGFAEGSLALGDYNNDGYLDILASGFSGGSYSSIIFKNDGNGGFKDISANLPNIGGKAIWGDYDNDGDLDIFLTGYIRNPDMKGISKIYRNDANDSFTDIHANISDVSNSSCAWGDYDNDGDLDILLIGFSFNYMKRISSIYQNNGNDSFSDIKENLPGISNGFVAWGDYDNDDDLDFLFNGVGDSLYGTSIYTAIYRNDGNKFNTKPTTPTGLTNEYHKNKFILKWNKSNDNQTEQNSLTYNISIGTKPYISDICSPMSNLNNGLRKIVSMGNAQLDTFFILNPLLIESERYYYWQVQAIDNSFAGSSFSGIDSFYLPFTAFAGEDKKITCGDSVNLNVKTNYSGTGSLNYSWYPSIDLSSTIKPNPIASPTKTTNYIVTVTSTDSLVAIDTVRVYIEPILININSDKSIICGGSTIIVALTNNNDSGSLNYLWYPTIGLSSSNIHNPIANPNKTTIYKITVYTSDSSCISYDSVKINVDPLTVNVGDDKTIICGNSTTLNALTNCNNCSLNYSWFPFTGLSNPNNSFTLVNTLVNSTYIIKVYSFDSMCFALDTISIFVKADSDMEFNTDKQSITSPPFTFQYFNKTTKLNEYNFTWYFGDSSFVKSNVYKTPHTYDFNGLYTVTLISEHKSNGCTDTLVKYNYLYCTGGLEPVLPKAEFTGNPTTIHANEFVSFIDNSTNSPVSWQWSFPSGNPSTSDVKNPINIEYNTPGVYNVSLKVMNVAGSDSITKTNYINVGNSGFFDYDQIRNLSVYPNPTTNNLIIENKSSISRELSCYLINILGDVVFDEKIILDKFYLIDLRNFPDGIYILYLQNGIERYTIKIFHQ